jgi:hypothetical protein
MEVEKYYYILTPNYRTKKATSITQSESQGQKTR